MGWCTLLVSAIVPTVVGSFGVLPAPCAVTTAFGGQCRHSASLTISDFRHRRNLAETVAMGWTSAARPNRHRPRIQELLSPLPAAVSNNGGEDDAAEAHPTMAAAEETARVKAETALRKLPPAELAGIQARLGLSDDLEGQDEIIHHAVPVLAAKILARQAAAAMATMAEAQPNIRQQEVLSLESTAVDNKPRMSPAAATPNPRSPTNGYNDNYTPDSGMSGGYSRDDEVAEGAGLPETRMARPRKEGSEREWVSVGGDGEERGWVGEKGKRRWVGPVGERPPRQRHESRQPEAPLAPGERAYFATCPRGLETVLRDELISPTIGATMVKRSGRGCHFRGDQSVGYKAIIWLRTAHRVLELIREGGAPLGEAIMDAESLYEVAAAVPWARYMSAEQTVSVDAILGVVPDGLTHSHFTALTVKNAVVDQFRDKDQQRPSVDTERPDLPLVVYLDRGRALLYRSLSGTQSMHKRGYRDAMHAASLKENVAAGLLLASGWDPDTQSIADPMCGSGTLVIEAALIAMRRAPGLVAMGKFKGNNSNGSGNGWGSRTGSNGWKPAVFSWPDFDREAWRVVVDEAVAAARPMPPLAIMGNDWHHGALSLAWRDAKAAHVEHCITLFDEDVARWRPPGRIDLAVTNPPWDVRLERGAEDSWQNLLEFLRREVAERDAWVLSGNSALSRVLRMKSEQNIFLATGGVELRWLKYHLNEYRGDRGRTGGGAGGAGSGRRGPRPKKVSRANDRPAIDRW